MARVHNDFQSMRQVFENCDLGLLGMLYSDDATVKVIDNTRPPSSPMELRGKNEISSYYRDICSRDIVHHLEEEVIGDDRISFLDSCRYSDGTKVLASNVLDLEGGKIKRQTIIQAWDKPSP